MTWNNCFERFLSEKKVTKIEQRRKLAGKKSRDVESSPGKLDFEIRWVEIG